MPITVACQCGAKFAAKDQLAGKAVKCPNCTQPLRNPGAAPVAKPSSPPPAATAPASVASILDELDLGNATAIAKTQQCPKCHANVEADLYFCTTCGCEMQQYAAEQAQQRQAQIKAEKAKPKPGDLTTLDVLLCAIIPGLGQIVASFYNMGENPKGKKMYWLSIFFGIAWVIVISAIMATMQAR